MMSCVIFNSAAPADATLLMAATKRQRHVQLFIRAERQKSRELELDARSIRVMLLILILINSGFGIVEALE